MPLLQSAVQQARRVFPRGWAPLIRMAARANSRLRAYSARMLDGDRMTLDLSQTMCLGYFFDGGVPHNQGLSRVMERVLEPGSVFVDVGANIGYFARQASRLVGLAGRVHVFEPLPSALPLLRANAAAHDNVTFHPLAVGATEGEIDFYVQAAGDTSSTAPDSAAERIRVPLTTLDAALAGLGRLDLVKLDVEGYELEVLKGAREVIGIHLPLLYFEYLDQYNKVRGLQLADYKALLEPLGYAFYWSNHGDGAALVTSSQSSDVVAIPQRWMMRVLKA